jgi:hypothetical protein
MAIVKRRSNPIHAAFGLTFCRTPSRRRVTSMQDCFSIFFGTSITKRSLSTKCAFLLEDLVTIVIFMVPWSNEKCRPSKARNCVCSCTWRIGSTHRRERIGNMQKRCLGLAGHFSSISARRALNRNAASNDG